MNTDKIKHFAEDIRQQFEKETGTPTVNSQGEPDIDYVEWLERIVASHFQQDQQQVREGLRWVKISDGVFPLIDEEVLGEDLDKNHQVIYMTDAKRFYTVGGERFYPVFWQRILSHPTHISTPTPQAEQSGGVQGLKAGDAWKAYIQPFSRLAELWDTIPEPTNIWLSQQIDIFAGKY